MPCGGREALGYEYIRPEADIGNGPEMLDFVNKLEQASICTMIKK